MTYRNNKDQGFTIVELTLAMTFISILLLAIVMLIFQIGDVYTKGMTLREVDRAGQVISSDIQRELNQSGKNKDEVLSVLKQTGGRLCVGATVYAWNYGKYLKSSTPGATINQRDGDASNNKSDIRFVKFAAGAGKYCEVDQQSGRYLPIPADASELLGEGVGDIAIHTSTYGAVSLVGDQTLYSISLRVGTETNSVNQGGVIGCQPGLDVDETRCAVNDFSFTARAGKKDDGGQ